MRLAKFKEKFCSVIENHRPFKVIWDTGRNFYVDDGFTFTAAISFYFLLSFIPFLILIGATVGYFVDYIDNPEQLVSYIMSVLHTAIPFLSEKYVSGLVNIANYKTGLTVVGVISLLISATLLFSTLHYSFFRIFGGKSINFILSRLMGAVFLLTLTILLFFVQYLSSLFISFAETLAHENSSLQKVVSWISTGEVYSFVVSTVIIVALFHILLSYFVYGIKLKEIIVLCGALLFSVLWNIAKLLYNFYITEISSISLLYGSAAWIISSGLWVYYSALILLLCMEFIKIMSKGTSETESPS